MVNGQQRILTITTFVAAIRDLAKTFEPGLAEYYHRRMIVVEKSYQKWSPRIICGDSTNEFYSKYIQGYEEGVNIEQAAPKTQEEKLIKNNYLFFLNRSRRN